MVTREDVSALIETRVRIKWGGQPEVALLRAVTPSDIVILAGEGGIETFVPLADVKSVEDARHECKKCKDRVNRVFGRTEESAGLCATCTREWAATQPVPREICEKCGVEGAFYSPAAKYFACAQCHAKRGTLTGIGPEARVLQAREHQLDSECKGADTDDLRHRWWHIKGHRYHCKLCPARRFDEPPSGTLWTDHFAKN